MSGRCPSIDVREIFLELASNGDPEPVYGVSNGHLDARGNRIVAEEIHERLRAWIE